MMGREDHNSITRQAHLLPFSKFLLDKRGEGGREGGEESK